MRVVIAHRSGEPKVVQLPEPKSGRHFVTVRISHSAMELPAELRAIDEAPQRVRAGEDGFPLGGTASGTIVEVGEGVTRLKSGLRVAVTGAPYVYHAAQLVVPENLAVELPKKVNHEEGSFVGQGAVAMQMLRSGGVQLGESVLIMGGDMLGLLAAQVVRAAGATPILVDESEFRLNKARIVGIAHAYTPGDQELVRTVEAVTDGDGMDAAFLTRRGDRQAMAMASGLLRQGGVLVQGAALEGPVELDDLREKALDVRSTIGGGPGFGDRDFEVRGAGYPRALARWTERDNMGCFANLLAERKIQISPLISDRLPLERAPVAYEKARRGRDATLAVVLTI